MPKPLRDPQPMLEQAIADWGGHDDLWLFGYGSLIWRPEFGFIERRPAWVHGWHRALKMWSRVNRGSVQTPGLVFGLLSGGSCRGMVFRVPKAEGLETLRRLWVREMPTGVYDPTLAALIGLKVPQGAFDGRCLDIDGGPGNSCAPKADQP